MFKAYFKEYIHYISDLNFSKNSRQCGIQHDFLITNRIKHEYFSAPDNLFRQEDTWFSRHGSGVTSPLFFQEDIRISRLVEASMLTEAWDRERFFEENRGLKPEADEVDRLSLISYLQQIVSFTGLLSGEEIRSIQRERGRLPLDDFVLPEQPVLTFDEVKIQTDRWKSQGLEIYMLHGAFDPPTTLHLSCATEVYVMANFQTNGLFRSLIGFESDISLRNSKGPDRPRYNCDWRRQTFGNFWMVDSTVEIRPQSYTDERQRIQDYRDLQVDRVVLAVGQEAHESRLRQIEKAGAEPVYIQALLDTFHSTDMLRALLSMPWFKGNE